MKMCKRLNLLVFILLLIFCTTNSNGQVCKVWPLGVCTSVTNSNLVKGAGFAFLEESVVNYLTPSLSDADFEKKLIVLKENSLKIEICNGFLPATLKVIGSNVNNDSIMHYAEIVFARAQKAGIQKIVFASGASRNIPQGFSKTIARNQFISLLKKLGDKAKNYNVILCIEPLNKYETNFINSIPEAISIIKEVNNSQIKLCVGYYHLRKENEPLTNIIAAEPYLSHIHIAEMPMRTAPGFNGDDFTPLFGILSKINYKGKIAIECGWQNITHQINEAYTQLDKQMCEGYNP